MSEATVRRGPPPVPGMLSAIGAVFRLQWRRLVRGKKLRLGLLSAGLIVASVVAARYATDADPGAAVRSGYEWGFFRMLAFLLPFLVTSGAIAEEVESRTFTYLASRPVGRVAITFGKYFAGALLAAALLVGSALLLHVSAWITSPTPMFEQLSDSLRVAGALGLLAMLYSAICMFWGALAPEAAGIVSALYLAILEFGLASMPGPFFWLRYGSLNFHAQRLAGVATETPAMWADMVPDVPIWAGGVWIAVATIGFLALAALVVQISEYRFGRA